MEIARSLTPARKRERKDEFRRDKFRIRSQQIVGSCRIDSRKDTEQVVVVHLQRISPVARPGDGSHQYGALLLMDRLVDADLEERLAEHIGPGAEFGVHYLLAESQFEGLFAHLFCPVAMKFREIVLGSIQIEHGGVEGGQTYGFLLVMRNDRPCLDDVFLAVGYIVQINFHGISVIGETDDGLFATLHRTLVNSLEIQVSGTVSVGMDNAQCRFKIIFVT